jgi:pimeloyl-ACP methyl ester carboxylesterase
MHQSQIVDTRVTQMSVPSLRTLANDTGRLTSIISPDTIGSMKILPAILLFALLTACGGDSSGPDDNGGDQGVAPTAGCTDGSLASGSLYRICFPADWNGELVMYAHGYVDASQPIAIHDDALAGQSVSSTVTSLGYAFATASYRANGLIVPEAVDDIVELQAKVEALYKPDPALTYVVGVSEGGLVAALAAEKHPDVVNGALAACGPVGDFQRELDYFGDFRVVFDYFFPGIIPGSVVDIPDSVQANWASTYAPAVVAAISADPDRTAQLLTVTGAPTENAAVTVVGVLWYNIFATEDAKTRLSGQPFDNANRVYAGSSDDVALNAGVARFTADPAAQTRVAQEFQTSGTLTIPVVTLHTTGDPIVPFEQETLFGSKVQQAGSAGLLTQSSADRYGHCAFEMSEVFGAFSSLIAKVSAADSVRT